MNIIDKQINEDIPIAKEGMRVHVFSPDHTEDWGFGTIEKVEPLIYVDDDGNETELSDNYPSVIKLDSGRITEGMECWWAPKEWADEYIRNKKDE